MNKLRFSNIFNVIITVLGFAIFLFWGESMLYVALSIGAICSISGILALIKYFRSKDKMGFNHILMGVSSLFLGLCLLVMPLTFKYILMYILSVIAIITSINIFIMLYKAKEYNSPKNYNYSYLEPLLTLIFGLLALINPFVNEENTFTFLGLALFANGISYFIILDRYFPKESSVSEADKANNNDELSDDVIPDNDYSYDESKEEAIDTDEEKR